MKQKKSCRFFSLGWLEQKQIRAYISEYQLQICCLMAYSVRKLAFLSRAQAEKKRMFDCSRSSNLGDELADLSIFNGLQSA